MQILKDFKKVLDVFKKDKKHFNPMLTMFHSKLYSGWERWFQFELMLQLCNSDYLPVPEVSFQRDGRISKEKILNRVDILCRKKNHSADYEIGIEIKIHAYPSYSVGGLLKDLNGMSHILKSKWNLRGVVGIAIFSKSKVDEIRSSKYKKFIERCIDDELADYVDIDEWRILLVGWEAMSVKSSSKEEYNKYLLKIKQLASSYDINV